MKKQNTQEKANAIHAKYAFFSRFGFSVDDAHAWMEAGFHYPHCARDWRDAGFSPSDAREWSSIGDRENPVTAPEAEGARASGETAQSYRRNRNRTYPRPMRTR